MANVTETVENLQEIETKRLFNFVKFYPTFEDFSDEDLMFFAKEAYDCGINCRNFEELYYGYHGDSYHQEREFARQFYTEMIPISAIEILESLLYYVDFDEVWNRELRYAFVNICGHFFSN